MAIENLTTYEEVDLIGVLTVTAPKVEGVDVDADVEAYLYKDFGVDHFDALNTLFEAYVNSTSDNAGTMIMGFSDTIDDFTGWEADSAAIMSREYSAKYRAFLMRGYGVASDFGDYNLDQLYYWKIVRSAGNDTINAYIYSDAARTVLVDTLTVAGYGTAKWRYLYAASSHNIATADQNFDGYFQDFDRQELTEKLSDDTGSGVDVKVAGNPLAILVKAETGSGVEALVGLLAILVRAETGLGSEFAAKILSALDSGSGTEAHIARLLAATETGSALEAAFLIKHLFSSDYGLGGDAIATLLALVIGSEVGSGSEQFRAKIVTFPGAFDMKLLTSAGEVRIPSKGVNL